MSTPFIWREAENFNFGTEIDVRAEVSELISNRGRWGFLRKARTQYSPDWNANRQEAGEHDPFNIETGFMYDDYWIQYRRTPTQDMIAGPGREVRAGYGIMSPQRNIFYLKQPPIDAFPDLQPTKADKIIEVTTSTETNLPVRAYDITKIWDIQQVHDYRDQNGRVEYWALLCEERAASK